MPQPAGIFEAEAVLRALKQQNDGARDDEPFNTSLAGEYTKQPGS